MSATRDPAFSNTAAAVLHWGRQSPNAAAFIVGPSTRSYAELSAHMLQFAQALRSLGVKPGMLIGIQTANTYLHLLLILACEALGAASLSLRAADLTEDAHPAARCDLLCIEATEAPARKFRAVLPLTQQAILQIRSIPPEAITIDRSALPAHPDDIVRVTKTSGTSSRPKLMANSRAILDRIVAVRRELLGPAADFGRYVSLYPFTYRQNVIDTMLALRAGATLVISTVDNLASDLRGHRPSRTILLPGDAERLVRTLPPAESGAQPPCHIHVDGGHLSDAVRAGLLSTIATEVLNSYSTNETNCLAVMGADGVGTLLPDASVRIVGEDGRPRDFGETGAILARSGRMVGSYLWDQPLSAERFADGWFHTGDVGFTPEPGRLVVTGRSDDILNLGGVKIAPYDIEARIRAATGADAVLLAIENEAGVGQLHVCIERRDPAAMPELRRQIEAIVLPTCDAFTLQIISRLPRTETGKIRRNLLKDMIRNKICRVE